MKYKIKVLEEVMETVVDADSQREAIDTLKGMIDKDKKVVFMVDADFDGSEIEEVTVEWNDFMKDVLAKAGIGTVDVTDEVESIRFGLNPQKNEPGGNVYLPNKRYEITGILGRCPCKVNFNDFKE